MLYIIGIWASADKHGIERDDMPHAWRNQLRYIELEYHGGLQLLVIGPSRRAHSWSSSSRPISPQLIIHADRLRPEFHKYLQ